MELWQKVKSAAPLNINIRREYFQSGNKTTSPQPTADSKDADEIAAPSRNDLLKSKKNKILLVIDSPETKWAKIFKGKQLHNGVFGIRIEQAEFADLNLASYTENGTIVDIQVRREGTVVVRSFRPDFVLVRQSIRGIGPREDYRSILLGLQFGNVPSVNSLTSIYNCAEKPWVFAQLIQIQKRLGKEKFPLIEQAFYPNYKEMLITPKFPVVVKVGHANGGYGKVCVQNHRSFQDIASVVALSDNYATTEPFIDGTCDLRIQKIGEHIRVFKRTSISDNWKTNTGSAVLEEVQLNDRYKLWIEECSKLFGGMDIVCVDAILGKDNKEHIIEVNDTAMRLFNDTLVEDQENMAKLVIQRMEEAYPPVIEPSTATAAALSGNEASDGGAFFLAGSTGSPTASAGANTADKPAEKKNNGIFSGIIDSR